MIISIVVLLVAYLPSISSSPTPQFSAKINQLNNPTDNIFDPREDSSSLTSSVQDRPFLSEQERAHANQFLMSPINDNPIVISKQFTRLDDHDADDDDIQDDFLINKRAVVYNSGGGYSHLKKRKQMTKPPMEVMNEIVNSIYLKR